MSSRVIGGRRIGPMEKKTADYTIVEADDGKVFSNHGASAAVKFSLPPATPGMMFHFYVGAAQELQIDPNGTETIEDPATAAQGAAGKYTSADAIGERVSICCVAAGTWSVFDFAGTWTAEL